MRKISGGWRNSWRIGRNGGNNIVENPLELI
jgi:hypothetical protein